MGQQQVKKLLELALLAGQIMCESQAESYRVEDTMNKILSLSQAAFAVGCSFSTNLLAIIDDPKFESGAFVGVKRITSHSNNLNKIGQVTRITDYFVQGQLDIDQTYTLLYNIRSGRNLYNPNRMALGIWGMTFCFTFLFDGGPFEGLTAAINGLVLALLFLGSNRFNFGTFFTNVIQASVVTLLPHLFQMYLWPDLASGTVVIASLMPLVPGTPFTTAVRDLFHEDFIAGSSRLVEALLTAGSLALGSIIAFLILEGVFIWLLYFFTMPFFHWP